MRQILTLLIIVALLGSVCCRRRKEQLAEQTETKDERKTVVEANHFYSNYETSTGYDINSVQKDKPLIFYLKPHNAQANDKTLTENPINITLTTGSSTVTCPFTSYTNLCSLPKVTEADMKLKIACKKTPCELSWIILQPSTQEEDGDHDLDQLVAVNQEYQHATLKVVCNNPDLKDTFASEVKLYSNSKFKKFETKMGMAMFLFSNEQKGYYFLTSENEKVRACANASLTTVNSDVDLSAKPSIIDFASPIETNVYQFKKVPTSDFRIEFSAHDGEFKELTNNTGLIVGLVGYKGGEKKQISQHNLLVDDEKNYIDFSLVYKKPTQTYDKIEFQLKGINRLFVVQMHFVPGDTQQVQLGEESYFDLKKGEKINYKLIPFALEIENAKSDKVNIFVDDEKRFKLSQTSCSVKGCDFTLEAIEAGQGNIYIGEGPTRNATEIIVQIFEKNVTKKIREGEQVYYSYKMKANEALQLLINSPSVIAYAAAKDKCERVDEEKCYEKNFNHHSPAIYEPTVDGTLLFKIIALDNCEFTLTVLDSHTPYIELKDTVPFTYLMDDKENFLIFYFNMSKKEDISFNLIAPVNELNLLVINKQKPQKGDEANAEISSDGFIKFAKADIKELMFVVKIEKREQYKNKYVHFTIIASTKEANLRLQPGVAHYETLQTKDSRDYVFQFLPKKNILLNFYTHNIKDNVKLKLVISNADQYENKDNSGEFYIDREVDVLDLSLVSKKLCKQEEGENCQLFVRIFNEMSVEADVTITLMMNEAIIELKDGIWQNYAVNMASASSHFYFMPKHQNHSATVFYKSSLVDLKIMYTLWKTDDKSIDPSEWPFPMEFKENEKLSELTFKPIDFIHIDPSQLTSCWPNCVILMSIAPDLKAANNSIKSMNEQALLSAQFKIMASNNYIELPEKHEVDIILVKNEEKQLLVDLKYFLEKEALNFYVYTTMGSSSLKVNVYSQKNPRCPNNDEDGDFSLSGVETKLSLEDIKSKLSENSMEDHRNVYLCILAQAKTDTKFTIEFSSDSESVKTLSMDGQATLKSKSGQITFYQIEASQQFELKIARNDGFPYISSKLCKSGKDMNTCVQQFKDNSEKGKQLAEKVTEISEKPCGGCLLIVKIDSEEPSTIVLHTQSKYTEVELIENAIMNDILEGNEQNRYTLTGTKNEQIIINVQIISGNLKVQVHDFQKIDLSKTNAAGSKNIHITIPSKDLARAKKENGASHMDSFGLSNFVHLHMTVQSQNPKQNAVYTITYSSGDTTVYLEDGLITEYNLVSKKPTKFLYMNPTNTPIYLHMSATDAQALQKLTTKMYAMGNAEDEDSIIQITPEKPDFKKKTPNPTILLMLPANKYYMIQLTNNNDKDFLFTIGVNNREIIYLPFDHEFPVLLAKGEYIYVVLNPSATGYIKISFSKCDESEPYVGYTMDYDEFVKEDFTVEEQMSDELIQDLIVKVKNPGGIYFKIRSDDDESSLMTIKATFSPGKISASRPKPGEKGLVKYQLLDSTKAELTFTSLVCATSEKGCNKDFAYSALSAAKPEDVFAQLVCSSIMIDFPGFQQLKSAEMTPITASPKDNKITFSQPLKGDISYVGIKAINSKTGEVVYYRPVEIVTFWGQLHRTSKWTIILGVVLMLIFMGGVLIVYRRWKKRDQYRSLGDMNDVLDRD